VGAVERIKKLEVEGNRPDAEKVLEELSKSGDMMRFQELLIKDRDENRDALIQRNREIAAVAYLRGDINIAKETIDEILQGMPDDIFALNQRGHIHKLQGHLKEAEDCYGRVLQLGCDASDNKSVQAVALGNLGLIYKMRGDLDKAEEMYLKSLDINEKLDRLEGMASSYGNLGNVYRRRGELDKAEQMYLKSLEIKERLGLQEGMANSYGNLGNVYFMRGELDKAEEMHLKSLEIDKMLGGLDGMGADYSNLGFVYEQRGDIGRAKEYWEKAL